MKKMIDIDASSFYQSGFRRLTWAITDQNDNGTMYSDQHESVSNQEDPHDAMGDHIDHISMAIRPNDLMDYELTLLYGDDIEEEKKQQFTELINEYNTRDEPS
jgi:hypothetical protein